MQSGESRGVPRYQARRRRRRKARRVTARLTAEEQQFDHMPLVECRPLRLCSIICEHDLIRGESLAAWVGFRENEIRVKYPSNECSNLTTRWRAARWGGGSTKPYARDQHFDRLIT